MIEIKVESHFKGYHNYNVIAMCGGFDSQGEKQYVCSARKSESNSVTLLTVEDAANIEVVIYFMPISLPGKKGALIKDSKPFDATVSVTKGTDTLYDKVHQINAWGGATIKLNF